MSVLAGSVALLVILLIHTPLMAQDTSQPEHISTRVVLLGTGNPVPEPERSGPAVAVVVGGEAYVVDFGPGVVRRAAGAERNGVRALAPANLRTAFCTHLHSDHTAGLPDLIFTPWVMGRDRPLRLFGPPGIRAMTEHVLTAWEEDIRIRLDGLNPASFHGNLVQVREIEPGVVYEDANVKVTAFAVPHGTWKHAFGYRFDTADRSVVISGDTGPSEELARQAKGCDVLVHEVYSERALREGPPHWAQYHTKFHTSGVELGKIAAEARPKLLVLYHKLTWSPVEWVLEEVRRNFDGEVVMGEDLGVY